MNNISFLKIMFSLKGQATIWEGTESFQTSSQFFFSKEKFFLFFYSWLCLGFKGGGAPKFPQTFLFIK
jgi:hypothetical protein